MKTAAINHSISTKFITSLKTPRLAIAFIAFVTGLCLATGQAEAQEQTQEQEQTETAEQTEDSAPAEESAQTEEAQPSAPAPETPQGEVKRPRAATHDWEPTGIDDYQIPLRFDPKDNNLSIHNPQLKYMMSNPNTIDLGGMVITADSIAMRLSQIPRDKAPVRFEDSARKEKLFTTLSFKWPVDLASSGTITIETPKRRVLWKKEFGESDMKKWKESLEYATDEMKKGHEKSTVGIIDINPKDFRFLYAKNARFRMCFSKALETGEKLRACSPPYQALSKGERVVIRPLPMKIKSNAGVFVGKRKLESAGLINFAGGRIIELQIIFGNFASINIGSQPKDPKLLDVVESEDGAEIILTGSGSKPLGGRPKIVSEPITHFWAPTGYEQDLIWQVALPRQSPTIRVPGSFNVPFTLYFSGDKAPKETDRVFVRQTRSSGTYIQAPKVYGYIPSDGMVSSEEYSARKVAPKYFEWSFAAPNKGEKNRARLLIQHRADQRPWVAHYEMFRSYPFEVSTRLTGILVSDFTFIILGEASANAWFETLAGIDHPYISNQRWGLGTKYHKSLTSIQSSEDKRIEDYSVINVDLRYNLLPGVWHRDEIVGLSLGFQQSTMVGPRLGNHTVQYLGLGAYWARTMPKIFNELFNLFPFMEYPKYVDMDFTLYPTSLTSDYSPGITFNLNFHGRVFWTERLYGEAGFGIRQTGFTFKTRGREGSVSLSAAYGTMGLGYRF